MTTKPRKRYYIMTGIRKSGRNRFRAIADYAHKPRALMRAALFGPLVWIEYR